VSHPPPARPVRRPPAPLLIAALLVGLEGLLLVGYGVAEVFALSGQRVAMGVTTALFFVLYGGVLAFAAWALTRLRSWARAPVVLARLIQPGVAWSFRGGSSTVAAVALALAALVVLAALLHPASLAALADDT
jgi:hypothetical protein